MPSFGGLLDLGTISGDTYTSYYGGSVASYWPQTVNFDSDGNNIFDVEFNNRSSTNWGPINAMALLNPDFSINAFWPVPFSISLPSRQKLDILAKTINLIITSGNSSSAGTVIGLVKFRNVRCPAFCGLGNDIYS